MTTPELNLIYPGWEIVKLLGEGSFGKVYEIRRAVFDREQRAALKVIHIPRSQTELRQAYSEGMDEASVSEYFHGFVRTLSEEIDLLSRLKGNSNIVSYEDHMILADEGAIGWTILIRMELLTPLNEYLRQHPMGREEVLRLGADICRALELCERHHIIHRDIKPDNIFVSPNGDFKLGDFGVARELEKTTTGLSRKGTFSYMAPEVFHGRPYNATVDIYSLGVVLYRLLNGNRTPFLPPAPQPITYAAREEAQQRQLSGEAFPPLPGAPAALNDHVMKMCTYEPGERFRSIGELAAALAETQALLSMDKTVSLRSWIGDNTPGVAPPMDATTEDEGSRWIDGTPVEKAKAPEPVPEPEPTPAPKKFRGKALMAVLVSVVFLLAGVAVAWMAMRGPKEAVNADDPSSSESSGIDYLFDMEYEQAPLDFEQPTDILNAATPMLSGSRVHTLALKSDGTVWAWGWNKWGQLGTDTPIDYRRKRPGQVLGLTGVSAVAAGGDHSLALNNDGMVWVWGYNSSGQLGDGTTTDKSSPVQVPGLTGVSAIAAGDEHSLALKIDGTVWAWGNNEYNQLGDGTTTQRSNPVQVPDLTGVSAVAAGYRCSLALKSDGTVWAWGWNHCGQLGDGTTTDAFRGRSNPVQVTGLTGVTAISTVLYYSLALKSDGTVWAWGNNGNGQLGDGTTTQRNSPVQVTGLTGVSAIAAGTFHSLALKSDGTVWAWGWNHIGQLGEGITTEKHIPVQVTGLAGVSAITAGSSYSLALLKSDGTVWAWGNNEYSQLGDGTTKNKNSPIQVEGAGGKAFFSLEAPG